MKSLPKNAVLLLVDVQKGFDEPYWGPRNNPQAEQNIVRLLGKWRDAQRPVFHLQHLSLSPGSPLHASAPGCELRDEVKPIGDERLFQKHVNSGFIGTDLEQQLRLGDHDTLVVVGLTTPHCISTTTRMAGNLGFEVFVAADATAAFDLTGYNGKHFPAQLIHDAALAALQGEFATVVSTAELVQASENSPGR